MSRSRIVGVDRLNLLNLLDLTEDSVVQDVTSTLCSRSLPALLSEEEGLADDSQRGDGRTRQACGRPAGMRSSSDHVLSGWSSPH